MIEVTEKQIERVSTILAGIPKGAERAVTSSMNRGLATVRKKATERAMKSYYIKRKDLLDGVKTSIKKATFGSLQGYVNFSGAVIPLIKFNVAPKTPERRVVTVSVLRNSTAKKLEQAFVAKMRKGQKNSHIGIFERITRERLPIEQLYGPSVPHMVGNQEVIKQIEADAQRQVDRRLEHEISRILNGYT